MEANNAFDLSLGAIFGALIGDASGATLEHAHPIGEKEVEYAMTMPGGGVHKLNPGQITDDGEMTLSLGHALAECQIGKLDINKIVKYYGKWIESHPFDIGNTIRKSIISCHSNNPQASIVRKKAAEGNQTSQSNGSLMRITPLAVYLHKIIDIDLFSKLAIEEIMLTHVDPTVQIAGVAYCLAIASLIRLKGDRKQAYEIVKSYIDKTGNQEVKKWISEAEGSEKINAIKKEGWAKYGFIFAFQYLHKGYDYQTAIKKVLLEKGDTDTNAAIVGGLIGCADGYSKLPESLKKPVENSKPNNGARKRPDFLWPANAINITKLIYEKTIDKIELVNGSNT